LRKELFTPSVETEARLLLLIDTFTTQAQSLEGRTKLAKLNFLLRYPAYLARAIEIRDSNAEVEVERQDEHNIENRMVRYRFGPWDPSYFTVLGRLIGKGLVQPMPLSRGIGFRVTENGRSLASDLRMNKEWTKVARHARLLKRHLDLSGNSLKKFVYQNFPEVTQASRGEEL
jgi:hypothetical protein